MYQKLVIVGRLGRDPEMRYTPTGQAVTSFSVATDRQYSDQSGKPVKETVWFKVTVLLKAGDTSTVNFSAQVNGLAESPRGNGDAGGSVLLAVIGGLILLAGVGVGLYARYILRK